MKNTLSVIALTLLIVISAIAQDDKLIANNAKKETKEVKLREMVLPTFQGGQEAMSAFIQEEISYPELAFRQRVEGVVLVNFRISKEGKIMNPYIAQSIHPELDKEALRLIQEMPKWSPALQNGEPREVAYQLPIRFELKN